MRTLRGWAVVGLALLGLLNVLSLSAKASLVATYGFDNTLAAAQGGVPALTATDPLGTNGFVADTVFGEARTVYAFNGLDFPLTSQAGLTFDNSGGLLPVDSYSVEMIFQFTELPDAWRRILDVQNRVSDNGLYVDPSNQLAVYPVTGGAFWTNSVYHQVVLTTSGNDITAYLDGGFAFSAVTDVMTIDNPENVIHFFLDNLEGGGLQEYSSGRVALINLFNAPLSADEVAERYRNPFAPASVVPEPASLVNAAVAVLMGGMGYAWRRRRTA